MDGQGAMPGATPQLEERRATARSPVGIEVVIDFRPAFLGRGRLRDASEHGLFVQTLFNLPLHAVTSLVFFTDRQGAAQLHRLEARVVRVAADGLALTFRERHSPAYQVLRQLAEPALAIAAASD
jgi:hypothetical protein